MSKILNGMVARHKEFLSCQGATEHEAMAAAVMWAMDMALEEFDSGKTSPDVAEWLKRALTGES